MSARSSLAPRLGVLGGLGPMASADFYRRIVELTPAQRDQEHVALALMSLPGVPDRSTSILAGDDTALEGLRVGVEILSAMPVELIAIACNTSHHWYDELSSISRPPILHIADCVTAELRRRVGDGKTLGLATRGTISSGFFQRRLFEAGFEPFVAADLGVQPFVDDAIRLVKAGEIAQSRAAASQVLTQAANSGMRAAILACTELPIAAEGLDDNGIVMVDSTVALARGCLLALGVEPKELRA